MKTAIMVDVVYESPEFFVIDGDYSYMEGSSIVMGDESPNGDTIYKLLWSDEGEALHESVSFDEFLKAIREGAACLMALLVS